MAHSHRLVNVLIDWLKLYHVTKPRNFIGCVYRNVVGIFFVLGAIFFAKGIIRVKEDIIIKFV